MALGLDQLRELPSPFYRVAVKAVIFDDQQRMLMVFSKEGNPEVPGGGWEHGESFEECLRREIQEELGAEVASFTPIQFTYYSQTKRGWYALRLAVRVELASTDFTLGDDMESARFVSKTELQQLHYNDTADAAIKNCIDLIWNEN